MELQRIIWSWDMLTRRLAETEPDIGSALFRSCRPVAAQRYRDGRLLVVLGCWWPVDQQYLDREASRVRLNSALGNMLSDKVVTALVLWPGGAASPSSSESALDQIPAPDILEGLPPEAREEAAKCESVVQRLFFARAHRRGLRLRCQHPLLTFRLDFALPERRLGAEVMGWDWRTGASGAIERRERQEQLEQHGWQILFFSGSQVLSDVDRCVATLAKAVQSPAVPGQQPLPTKYSPFPRKPYTSIGVHRPADRGTRRPKR
ncbi:MAG: DUF559 domain-containing protein [Chloroflexi bacterium]|nr:DUF559 domain-containing protein [Chloroflexota bacterium]